MTEKQKYYTIGGIMLALIGFLGYKAFAKPKKVAPVPPKKRATIIVGEGSGGFMLPAEVTTRSGTRLRSSSSTNSSVVHTYTAGTKLLVKGDATESDGQWFQVFDSNGRSGWVRSDVVDYKITTSEPDESFQDPDQEYWDYLEQIHG